MTWWQLAFFGGCAGGTIALLSSIDRTLEGIKQSIDLGRTEADRQHERLLHNLYNLSKVKRTDQEEIF